MTITNTVDKIRSFYEQDIATRIPFDLHPLQHATDYQKQLYGTMLAMLIQYENDAQKEQTVLLQRIMKGAGIDLTLQQLLQNAKTADEKFAKDFYDEFTNNDLAKNFTVDALMLVYAVAPIKEKQLTFVSELVSVLNIDLEMFQMLVQFTKAVLTQNSDELYALFASKPTLRLLNQFEYYYGSILDTSVEKVLELANSTQDILVFANTHFTQNMDIKQIENHQLVIFKNCIFTDFNLWINLYNIHSVVLDNCIIKKSELTPPFFCYHVENIYMYKCKFIDIKQIDDYGVIAESIGGAVYSYTPCNIYVFESLFKNIILQAASKHYSYANGLICASRKIRNYHVENNQFEFCNMSSKNGTPSYFSEYDDIKSIFTDREIAYTSQTFVQGQSFTQFILKEYDIELKSSTFENNKHSNCTPDFKNIAVKGSMR